MTPSPPRRLWLASRSWAYVAAAAVILGAAVGAAAIYRAELVERWQALRRSSVAQRAQIGNDGTDHDHVGHAGEDADHGHEHAGHDEANSIHLSPQARRNIGLKVGRVARRDYERTITVPAIVDQRPGQTMVQVSAPLTGMVTGLYITRGQAVQPGDLLFKLRLTHEDLVQTQTEFLKTLGALDVERRELARLEKIAEGAVARKTILERQYELEKLEALLRAQREGLMLHGLSEQQVQQITEQRQLLRELAIYAPEIENHDEERQLLENLRSRDVTPVAYGEPTNDMEHPLVVQQLDVFQGDVVTAGSPLATLADLKVLYIEGRGFEQDAEEVIRAANERWPVTALFEDHTGHADPLTGLQIVFVSNEVESESRAFQFYVALPNEIVRDVRGPADRRFVAWRYKPGQRAHLLVPVERWTSKLVLPVEAVAQQGPETYVFVQRRDHFERLPVSVEYRGQREVIIADDGSLKPGAWIAMTAAHQLQMALTNKSGPVADAHAGHSH